MNMKMIYLANARIPTEKAHGLQIMKMCEAFKNAGVGIELVVAKRVNNQLEKFEPFSYYGIETKFPIEKLRLIDVVAMGRSFKGLSVIIQNTTFAISAFFYCLRKKVDLIYSRDEFSLFLLCLFKRNLVLELHTFPQSKFFLYKILFKRVKKIVVITNFLKKLLVEKLGIDQDKILVSPDGVDIKRFQIEGSIEDARKHQNLPLDRNIILYTGHLFAWKGVYTLVEASKFLSEKELIFIVGGMEYDRIKLAKFIKDKKLRNISFSKGHVPPVTIPYFLKAADVLVLPNSAKKPISVYYTSPIKMFEYMAARRPIVASELPSIKEILNSNNAVMVRPDDSLALAQGIKKVLADSDFADRISQQAYQDVLKYTWQKRAEKILNFIKNK